MTIGLPNVPVCQSRPRVQIYSPDNKVRWSGGYNLLLSSGPVRRILWRPFRPEGAPKTRVAATFYWQDGSYSSVCFASYEELAVHHYAAAATGVWPRKMERI